MRYIKFIILALGIPMLLNSCMKETDKDFYFTNALAEFDLATNTANAPGVNYPLLAARLRGSGLISYRINLLGQQLSADQAIALRINGESTTAVEGVHYRLPNGLNATFPANSSFANLDVEVLDFPAQTTGAANVVLVFEIVGNDVVKPSENHKSIGVQINVR
ncbi:DUF4843 domain-containing protein [Sphingobacterium corticibacter]|uniref:DUF4843 domain-containing protein n=1 Tax=Sphingobacterium corticibacter TaxID=2171749 RepID=A0A2T8HLQ1_9SPHI|nr:DUF4843 domain-containing protein [Sphingobacterium corticibacter]PVH26367.1 hypothetical protein DC487_01705 [Sphingobacterium corticibacter]